MYASHAAMCQSASLRSRVTACAAQEGATDPPKWVAATIWSIPKADWLAAWDYAEAANPGGDHGADPAVITDQMILSAVQPMITTRGKPN